MMEVGKGISELENPRQEMIGWLDECSVEKGADPRGVNQSRDRSHHVDRRDIDEGSEFWMLLILMVS